MLWCWLGLHSWYINSQIGKFTQKDKKHDGIFILKSCLYCTRKRAYFERVDGKRVKLSVAWLEKAFKEW